MIRVVQDDITPGLAKLQTALQMGQIGPSIGNIGLADIQRNIITRGANINRIWPPLSPLTIKMRAHGGDVPLQDTKQHLMNPMHYAVLNKSVEIRTNFVANHDGKQVDVAAVLHYGTRRYKITNKQRMWFLMNHGIVFAWGASIQIPARPFMELSSGAIEEVEELPAKITGKIQ